MNALSLFPKSLRIASLLTAFATSGCLATDEYDDQGYGDELDITENEVAANTLLDRLSSVNLRVASWNTFRGSVFPKTDNVWKTINLAGQYDTTRTENAKGVFKAVNADVWLLQETAYQEFGLPSGITQNDVNNKISSYMKSITGDSTWQVKCNGLGLCLMVRGNIKIDDTCMGERRVNGYMLRLPSFNNASLAIANVHYKSLDQVADTVDMMTDSAASAKIVVGDFNGQAGGDRFNAIDDIPTLAPISMNQAKDSGAIHLKASVANGTFSNTHGSMTFSRNENGQALASSEAGNRIDHFFLGSTENSWNVRKKLVLNSLLLSKATLKKYNLSPLAAAIVPATYAGYFSDFMTTGKVKPITNTSVSSTVSHDHLPLIVDLAFTNAPSKITPQLVCP